MRRLAIALLVITPTVVVFAAMTALGGPASGALAPHVAPPSPLVEQGRELFLTSCTACHGKGGVGTPQGPALVGAGAASADFQLSTGRMPLADPSAQPVRKQRAFDPSQIRALVAYVASLGPGPAIPHVDPTAGSLSEGGTLFRFNCAACHSASGVGGALSFGTDAPSLRAATATQIGEAVRVGPGQMPVFGPDTFSDHQVNSLARVRAVPPVARRSGRVLARAHRTHHRGHGRAVARHPPPPVRLHPHRGEP